ncbi:MAG: hypothetical protein N2Z40_05380 [Caldimicrobium sp.]|nr:hypothetical protein [Caldimicrobium sp.]MCX7613634.1 hypothetical protein [Caldimicrobium sp.]MDW8183113.1 hypothetical protein [Caldimicrobium sp.]
MSKRAMDASNVTIDDTFLPNCRNATATGIINLTIEGSVTCEETGHVSNCTATGRLEGVDLYKAKCELKDQSLHCNVVPSRHHEGLLNKKRR